MSQHVRKTAVGLRRLVEIGAQQRDAAVPDPRVHLVLADPSCRYHFAGFTIALAAGLGAGHDAASAVHGRIQTRSSSGALNAREDHGIIAHRTAYKSALTRECRGRALADDPEIAIAMVLTPSVVVVIVHGVNYFTANDPAHTPYDPFSARIGVQAGKPHAGDVLLAEVAVLMNDAGVDVDSILAAAKLEELGRGLMAKSARTEVHANPDPAIFVGEQVYIMVPRPDCPELITCHSLEVRDFWHILP